MYICDILYRIVFNEYSKFYDEVKDKEIESFNYARIVSKTKYLWQCTSEIRSQYFSLAKRVAELSKIRSRNDPYSLLQILKQINEFIKKQMDGDDHNSIKCDSSECLGNVFPPTGNRSSTSNNNNSNRGKEINSNIKDPPLIKTNSSSKTPEQTFPLFTIKENSNILFMYDHTRIKALAIQFPESTTFDKKFNWNCRSAQTYNKLFVTGGHDENNISSRRCLEFTYFNPDKQQIVELKPMTYPHWGHGMLLIPPKFLVVISGSFTPKCEYYDIDKKAWTLLSEIHIWRMDPTCVIVNSVFLYTIGGCNSGRSNNNPFVEKIERIKLFSPLNENIILSTNKWEFVKLTSPTIDPGINNHYLQNLIKKTCMGVLKLSDNKIFLIGGDTSDYLKEPISNDMLVNRLGSTKIIYHTSLVGMNFTSQGCEIEKEKSIELQKPCCFTMVKNFKSIGDNNIYGCFNHRKELCVLETNGEIIVNNRTILFE